MKKWISIIAALLVCHLAMAQGISFEHGNWASVKAKAAKAHKLVYLDVFTTWCGPCKMMARNYFPAQEAGDFYNKQFINYQIDAEKGEGLDVAKTYNITGYPTNLFIEPATGKVIYRTMGMPADLKGFIQNGKTALLESKDPMKLPDYEKKFKSGKYDMTFLKKYMEKNNRLDKDNDVLIDTFLSKYGKNNTLDSNLMLVSKYQSGVDNDGFKLMSKNKERLNSLKGSEFYYDEMSQQWYLAALEKDVEQKDEKSLNNHLARLSTFNIDDPKGTDFYYRQHFLKGTGNTEELRALNIRYANDILNMKSEMMHDMSLKQQRKMEKQIEWQAKQMGVSSDELKATVIKNMERPEVKYATELNYANTLNNIAWSVYEENKTNVADKGYVLQAVKWAEKGMQLSEKSPSTWMPVADTYAHLLFLLGKKEDASKVQQQVVKMAKETDDGGLNDYEDFLKQLH